MHVPSDNGHEDFIRLMEENPNCKVWYEIKDSQRVFTLKKPSGKKNQTPIKYAQHLRHLCMGCNKDFKIKGLILS